MDYTRTGYHSKLLIRWPFLFTTFSFSKLVEPRSDPRAGELNITYFLLRPQFHHHDIKHRLHVTFFAIIRRRAVFFICRSSWILYVFVMPSHKDSIGVDVEGREVVLEFWGYIGPRTSGGWTRENKPGSKSLTLLLCLS